jgi:hypothetical protein
MFDLIAAHLQALPLALQLVGVMVLLAAADFAFAVIAHLKAGDFHGTLFGEWITSKGLPILVVALLYGLDAAIKIIPVSVGGTDLGAFGALAYAQAVSFIAQEAFSVVKNAKLFTSPGIDEPVPEE